MAIHNKKMNDVLTNETKEVLTEEIKLVITWNKWTYLKLDSY